MNRYTEIDNLKNRLNELRALQSEKVVKALEIEYTYESNKIEGNTLTLQETALVIEKGLTIGGKTLNEHLEAVNHTHAIDFIKEIAKGNEPITERLITEIHALILKGIDNSNAGRYRNVPVLISGAKHVPPQPYAVPLEMEKLMQWYNDNKDTLHPIELASEMHERLVTIHPFIDGNGRTSRLLMNLILLRWGYPIAILKGDTESRLKYYNTLETAQIENDKRPFIDLIADNIRQTIERIIKIVEG
ncbi:cell division protein Fic [Capnocytophaga cynodegmi]|uniref:Fic family protein n=1 Tax=Capnocytophaga cynodegmi TaxID=28189 RepID=UPI001AC47C95|nr:Fic family protein [Capnocytophaga cynodegmi]GIM52737.1 cell division protein Fic [Capnocytophaga cynodegmi]